MGKRKSKINYSVVFSVGSCNRLAAFPLILLIKFGTCHYILKNRQWKSKTRKKNTQKNWKVVFLVGDDPGGGAFALFFCPHPGVFEQLKCPHPGEFANLFKKKCLCPGVCPGGGALLELTGALYIAQTYLTHGHDSHLSWYWFKWCMSLS